MPEPVEATPNPPQPTPPNVPPFPRPTFIASIFPSSRDESKTSTKVKMFSGLAALITGGEVAGLTPDQILMLAQIGTGVILLVGIEDIVRAFRKG